MNEVESLPESVEPEAMEAQKVPEPPADGWTKPASPRRGRGGGLFRKASVLFFGKPPRDNEEHYHENILGGFATSRQSTLGSSHGGAGVGEGEQPSPLRHAMTFGFHTRTLTLCLIMLALCFFLPAHLLKDENGELHIYLDIKDPDILFEFIATTCSIVPILVFMVWAAHRVVPKGEKKPKDPEDKGWCSMIRLPGRTPFLMLLSVTINVFDNITREIVREEHQDMTLFLINRALAFTMFAFWTSALDDGVELVHNFADKAEAIVAASPKSATWKGFMFDMAKFQDPVTDKAYAIPGGSRSPARVLAEIVGVYCTIGKCAGFFFLFLFMVGVDLYSSLVTFGLSALFLSVISSLHINDALANLLPLAVSNAFHMGEIVALSNGASTANDPTAALTGFVEGITWSHVVLRDFNRKQVFVPHKEMTSMSIYNWSRRPGKCLDAFLTISVTHGGGVAKVGSLCKFALQWIKDHPQIDSDKYKNCKFKVTSAGKAKLTIICYPITGAKFKVVQAELAYMLLEACKRLNLCIIGTHHFTDDLWNGVPYKPKADAEEETTATEEETLAAEDDLDLLSDLKPSEELSQKTGLAKQKKA